MTTKAFRNAAFVPTEDQATKLEQFEEVRSDLSKRKQCQWLASNTTMSTGDIAKYLEIRFQQVYQAIKK